MASDGTITERLHQGGTAAIPEWLSERRQIQFRDQHFDRPSFADVTFNGTFDGTSIQEERSTFRKFSIDFTGVKPTSNSSVAQASSMLQGDAR